jgi:hypothetical protein
VNRYIPIARVVAGVVHVVVSKEDVVIDGANRSATWNKNVAFTYALVSSGGTYRRVMLPHRQGGIVHSGASLLVADCDGALHHGWLKGERRHISHARTTMMPEYGLLHFLVCVGRRHVRGAMTPDRDTWTRSSMIGEIISMRWAVDTRSSCAIDP